MHSPALKKISNKIQEGITWNSNFKKKMPIQISLSAVQSERTQWVAGGDMAGDAGEPRWDVSLPGGLLPGVPRSSCSSRGESVNVS